LRDELAKRDKAGRIEVSLAEQARVLREWLKAQHPKLPCPAQTLTENGLRTQYWAARNPQN
jgi:hypothetical protein